LGSEADKCELPRPGLATDAWGGSLGRARWRGGAAGWRGGGVSLLGGAIRHGSATRAALVTWPTLSRRGSLPVVTRAGRLARPN
jgi:hypothetical protein